MKLHLSLALAVIGLAQTTLASTSPPINDSPPLGPDDLPDPHSVPEASFKAPDLPNPLATAQAKARLAAIEDRVRKGLGRPGSKDMIEHVASGQFVQLGVEGTDNVWTLLGEFTDVPHNSIPEPHEDDNVMKWIDDFSAAYYQELLFSDEEGAATMTNYFLEQSGGRYKVYGTVEDWVLAPNTMDYYGNNNCGEIVCPNVWEFVCDTANAWYQAQIEAGKSQQEITEYLSAFDVNDRYDHDGDGIFDEPDGYIDHMQFVHADIGEEAGGSPSTIWSHRWYVVQGFGVTGPSPDYLLGGCEIGESGIWIGDYTINPENGGLGVFSHEYGHDLGLPDLYDRTAPNGIFANAVGFWDLYGSGGWLGDGGDSIGDYPGPMNSWEKLVLGWLDYEVVGYQEHKSVRLGPITSNSKATQAAIVLLPDKIVSEELPLPPSGDYLYFSGSGDELSNSMSLDVTIPSGTVSLSAEVWFDIETHWDYAYVLINGAPLSTSVSTTDNPNGQNFGYGITGSSGGWTTLSADLSAYSGQTVTLEFFYWTDAYVVNPGFFVDDIFIGGSLIDDAETEGTPAWEFNGFERLNAGAGTIEKPYRNYYLAEYRTYRGSDKYTELGPYWFYQVYPERVSHYPYQDGLLVWYRDFSFTDNDNYLHCLTGRCGGMLLPVDANPGLYLDPRYQLVFGWDVLLESRVQTFDSTFSLDPVEEVCFNVWPSLETCIGGTDANPLFDDTNDYWGPDPSVIGSMGQTGVAVPKTGTTIKVVNTNALKNFMQIEINGASS